MQETSPFDVPYPAISLANVTAGYERLDVLNDLSLAIDAGQLAGIVGPTASGKSTLLRVILGLHPFISG